MRVVTERLRRAKFISILLRGGLKFMDNIADTLKLVGVVVISWIAFVILCLGLNYIGTKSAKTTISEDKTTISEDNTQYNTDNNIEINKIIIDGEETKSSLISNSTIQIDSDNNLIINTKTNE